MGQLNLRIVSTGPRGGMGVRSCWCGNQELEEYSAQYARCGICQSLVDKKDFRFDPGSVRDDGDDLYGKAYWEVKMLKLTGKKNLDEVVDLYLEERCVYWLKHLLPYLLPEEGSVAEVGCGLGQFSYLLRQAGYRQQAFELSPDICAYIRRTLGVSVVQGELRSEGPAYRCVAAFDVLEHMQDPHAFMDTVSSVLEEDGILFFQTPCYDPALTHAEMLRQKPRFQNLMVEDEHIYLFSRPSVQKLLADHGFRYVEFIPAFFGDDYDMFFAASRQPLRHHTEEEIRQALNRQPNGRLLRAFLRTWTNARTLEENIRTHDQRMASLGQQVGLLTDMVHQKDAALSDRENQIEQLTDMVHQKDAALTDRQGQIEQLTSMVHQKDAALTDRQDQIEQLTSMVHQKDAALADRQDQIEQLTDMVHQKDAALADRQDQIEQLTSMVHQKDAALADRQGQIEQLTQTIRQYEVHLTSRQSQIEELTRMVHEAEKALIARQAQPEPLNDRPAGAGEEQA